MSKTTPIHDPEAEVVEEMGRIAIAWGRVEYVIKLTIKTCLCRGSLAARSRRAQASPLGTASEL